MRIEVLDHGYVQLIELWGRGVDDEEKAEHETEAGIIEAARQSTQGSFRGWDTDRKLLAHLYNNKHLTPFEFAGMVIEVQAPIFVFREWQRHRTQSYNEMSARYAPLPDLYYLPTQEALKTRILQGLNNLNKQQQGTMFSAVGPEDLEAHAEQVAINFLGKLNYEYAECEGLYQKALHSGIPKELARLVMPVGHYSRMRCSANLRNWLAFLTLRQDPAAQWEIRQFAGAVAQLIEINFPETYKLFRDANPSST